jgi:DNA-binding beta-propeller fold protein YncE
MQNSFPPEGSQMRTHFATKLAMCLLVFSAQLALAQSYVGQISVPIFFASDIAVNPLTDRVYVTSSNPATVSIYNGRTRALLSTILTGDAYAMSVAVNPTTHRVYVGTQLDPASQDCSVVVIDGRTNRIIDTIHLSSGGGGLVSIAVNPTTNRVYVADANNLAITVIDGATDRIVDIVGLGNQPKSVAVNHFTNRIYAVVNSPAGQLFEIDGRTNRLSEPIAINRQAAQLAIDVMNNRIFILASELPFADSPGAIFVVEGRRNRLIKVIPDFNTSIAVDPLTNRLWAVNLTAGDTGTVSLINAKTSRVISNLSIGLGLAGKIVVNPVTNTAYVLGELGKADVLSGR